MNAILYHGLVLASNKPKWITPVEQMPVYMAYSRKKKKKTDRKGINAPYTSLSLTPTPRI